MKSVLISIQPKWCELIASGKKTAEVRKTKPKLDVPFKCYIYCTLQGSNEFFKEDCNGDVAKWNRSKMAFKKGKVIGEFVCDCMTSLKADNMVQAYYNNTKDTCLTDEEIKRYANGKKLYYWHISDLKIYDKPKELGEFCTVDNEAVQKCENRVQSYHQFTDTGYIKNGFYCEETTDWCNKCKVKPIKRPPQSWCYVESKEGESNA